MTRFLLLFETQGQDQGQGAIRILILVSIEAKVGNCLDVLEANGAIPIRVLSRRSDSKLRGTALPSGRPTAYAFLTVDLFSNTPITLNGH